LWVAALKIKFVHKKYAKFSFDIDKFAIRWHNKCMEEQLIERAKQFAREKHKEQVRDYPTVPYISHPENVYQLVRKFGKCYPHFDVDFACTVAILHDIMEDTNTSYEQVSELFGTNVADAVLALTKNKSLPTPFARIADSIERIKQQPREVAIVKMCDRIDNIAEVNHTWSKEKSLDYANESQYIAYELEYASEELSHRLEDAVKDYREKIESFYSVFLM
jgi:(p)ppGpp synthase/HD superfamily hydrolase